MGAAPKNGWFARENFQPIDIYLEKTGGSSVIQLRF
jgi:hypothetical protein